MLHDDVVRGAPVRQPTVAVNMRLLRRLARRQGNSTQLHPTTNEAGGSAGTTKANAIPAGAVAAAAALAIKVEEADHNHIRTRNRNASEAAVAVAVEVGVEAARCRQMQSLGTLLPRRHRWTARRRACSPHDAPRKPHGSAFVADHAPYPRS